MNTGTLTPRCENTVDEMRFSGGFRTPGGFSSVLTVSVRRNGGACLTLDYQSTNGESQWSVMITNEQRKALATLLAAYEPVLFERTSEQP